MQCLIVPGALPAEGFVRQRQIIGGERIVYVVQDGRRVPIKRIEQGVLPMSKASWLRGVADGRYPRGIKHGAATLYDVRAIRELLDQIKITGEAAEPRPTARDEQDQGSDDASASDSAYPADNKRHDQDGEPP